MVSPADTNESAEIVLAQEMPLLSMTVLLQVIPKLLITVLAMINSLGEVRILPLTTVADILDSRLIFYINSNNLLFGVYGFPILIFFY
jgi:hypothetical protein